MTFWRVLGILGAVIFSCEGGGAGGAGGTVQDEMMISWSDSISGFSILHITLVSDSEQCNMLENKHRDQSQMHRCLQNDDMFCVQY